MQSHDDLINQQIFEYSVDLILVTDRAGLFLRVSPSCRAILGYDPGDMMGRSAIDFVYPGDLDNVRMMMRHARVNGVTRHFECRYVHKSGAVKSLVWTGVWVAAAARHFFIGRDVTALRIEETFLEIAQLIAGMNARVDIIHHNLDDAADRSPG